jgi:anaphase-promoting complex subunit 10
MPRPARRAAYPSHDATTTPTRTTTTNAITAAIPPFMLETPPHAPFVTTPLPPSINPGHSIIPDANTQGRNGRGVQASQQTPTANGNGQAQNQDQSQLSSHALGSTTSQTQEGEDLFDLAQDAADDARQLVGLRDISSLATWTLSSAKPGCGLPQLRHPSPANFWQSDGPQPHTLTLHFFKLVAIVKLRIYLDFEMDESYTPTKMMFFAGMSEGGLVEFGEWQVQETLDPETGEAHSNIEHIHGWIDIPLKGVGGRESSQYQDLASPNRPLASRSKPAITARLTNGSKSKLGGRRSDVDVEMEDATSGLKELDFVGGDVLKAMVVQVRICENHQNGKDTHVRGFQVFARDEVGGKTMRKTAKSKKVREKLAEDGLNEVDEIVGLQPAEWMGDPEIR